MSMVCSSLAVLIHLDSFFRSFVNQIVTTVTTKWHNNQIACHVAFFTLQMYEFVWWYHMMCMLNKKSVVHLQRCKRVKRRMTVNVDFIIENGWNICTFVSSSWTNQYISNAVKIHWTFRPSNMITNAVTNVLYHYVPYSKERRYKWENPPTHAHRAFGWKNHENRILLHWNA